MLLQIYLAGFFLVALVIQLTLRFKEGGAPVVVWAVSVTYGLIWPIAVPIDLTFYTFKRLRGPRPRVARVRSF